MEIKNYYSQKDPRWSDLKLGTSNTTIGQAGCFLTCLAMLSNKYNPQELNELAINNDCFVNGNLLNSGKLVKLFSIVRFERKVNEDDPCIMITNYYKDKGVPTHFVVLLSDGRIIDPLDINPQPKENIYEGNIIGIRYFKFNNSNKNMNKFKHNYEEIYNQVLKETGIEPIFNSFDGQEKEIKYLLAIGLARLEERIKKYYN